MMSSHGGSISAKTPESPRLYGYTGCRAALNAISRLMSFDLKERGIKLALITPGFVDTKGILDLGPDDPGPPGYEFLVELVRRGNASAAMIRPPESVKGLRRIIDDLTLENSGEFINYDGTPVPW